MGVPRLLDSLILFSVPVKVLRSGLRHCIHHLFSNVRVQPEIIVKGDFPFPFSSVTVTLPIWGTFFPMEDLKGFCL